MASTKPSNFKALHIWKEGILEKNIRKMKAALDAGVPPETSVLGNHPLFMMLTEPRNNSKKPKRIQDNWEDMVDMMIDHGLNLLEPLDNDGVRLIDYIVFDVDTIVASKLTYAAIIQSLEQGQPFAFDLERVFEFNKPVPDDVLVNWNNKENYLDMMSILKEVHEYTRLALDYPLGASEKSLHDICQDGDLTFWQEEFPYPTEDFIKENFQVTYEEYDKALQEEDRQLAKESMSLQAEVENEAENKTANTSNLIKTLEKEKPADILKELDGYIGLESFKKSMRSLVLRIQFDQARQEQKLKTDGQNYHTAFLGNPGTGKTTCARIKARLLHSLGLTGPRYAELSRDDIVGNYIGQTENKLKEILKNVDTVFIDEAYSLTDGSQKDSQDYGKRALDVLVAHLGNEKDPLSLFVAGYSAPMKGFIESNEGLKSRIKIFDTMEDFSMAELGQILDENLAKRDYSIDADARQTLLQALEQEKQEDNGNNKHFGNARDVVNIVQDLPNHMAARLAEESDGNMNKFNAAVLSRITMADVKSALKTRKPPQAAPKQPMGFQMPKTENPPQAEPKRSMGFKCPTEKRTAAR